MFLKTQVRRYAVEWIEKLAKGSVFHLSQLYQYLKADFAEECDQRGFTSWGEPRYQHDARWAVQDCKFRRMVRLTGKRGTWERV